MDNKVYIACLCTYVGDIHLCVKRKIETNRKERNILDPAKID